MERAKLTPVEAVEMVIKARGLPVLAHPAGIDGLEEILGQLKAAGLVGLEAYYNGYTRQTIDWLVDTARKHGLIISGGSDFHGFGGRKEKSIGGINMPSYCVEQFIALAEQPWTKVVTQ